MKVKIKARGSEAKELLGMKAEFNNAQKSSGGKPMMRENPASRRVEDSASGPAHGTDYMDKTLPVPTAENVQSGYDVVKTVNRVLPAFYPEEARKKNNSARDQRTNLGRTVPVTLISE